MTAVHHTFFKSDQETRVDLALDRERKAAAKLRAVYKAVDERDHRRCRACGRKSNPDAVGLTKRGHRHHIVYRSAGGPTTTANVVTICFVCHDDEHVKRTLDIQGDADDALSFWRKDVNGVWFLWRRELTVGHFEQD